MTVKFIVPYAHYMYRLTYNRSQTMQVRAHISATHLVHSQDGISNCNSLVRQLGGGVAHDGAVVPAHFDPRGGEHGKRKIVHRHGPVDNVFQCGELHVFYIARVMVVESVAQRRSVQLLQPCVLHNQQQQQQQQQR